MRYPYFDNAKAILIFLVVLGHLIVQKGEVGGGFYWLIYSFHMPAFIFVAGYFTKKDTWESTISSSIGQFILPYLIFQSLYNLYNYYLFGIKMNLDIEYANFALWFLLAMVYWKVTLQVIVRWKWTLIPFAILYLTHRFFITDLNYFDIGRAVTFSVFFYLGHFAKTWTPHIIQFVQRIRFRAILFPIVGVCGLSILTKLQQIGIIQMKTSWFYGKFDSFTALLHQQSAFELVFYQVQITLFSLLMVGLFLLIVPTKEYAWTSIGTATLSIYLLHGFIRNIFVHSDLLFKANNWGELLALASLSLLIVFVFSRKPCHSFVVFLSSLIKKKQN